MRHLFSKAKKILSAALVCLFLCSTSLPALAAEGKHTVYAGPSAQSAVLSAVSDGERVTVLDRQLGRWARIMLSDGTTGYCEAMLLSASFVQENAEELAARTLYAVALYQSADTESSVLRRLAANSTVLADVPQADDAFVCVRAGGSIGYLPIESVSLFSKSTATVRSVPTFSARGATTEAEAAAELKALSGYFEGGLYWNSCDGFGGLESGSPFCLSSQPCAHLYSGYTYCNIYNGTMATYFPEYGDQMQCLGFASLLSDLVFGTDAPVSVFYDFDQLRVGDHIRLVYYEHSMIVTAVGREANGTRFVRVAEVNTDYENCEIEWGRLLTENDLAYYGNGVQYVTRYPEN